MEPSGNRSRNRGSRLSPSLSLRPGLRHLCRGLILLAFFSTQVFAQAARESDVEAAYLFNFARFMHVPPHNVSEFRIGILGQDPFSGTLQKLTANETADGRRMRVVMLTTPEEARSCDIVFLGESETPRLAHDLALLDTSAVLTVSRIPGFLDHGGMIQFLLEQDRVRFGVNLNAAERAHVQLSSELLKVAVRVTSEKNAKGPAA